MWRAYAFGLATVAGYLSGWLCGFAHAQEASASATASATIINDVVAVGTGPDGGLVVESMGGYQVLDSGLVVHE